MTFKISFKHHVSSCYQRCVTDYDVRNFDWGIFPYIITGLFFLTTFLKPAGSLCRNGGLIIGIIGPCLVVPTRSYELALTK